MATVYRPAYCTREQVRAALDIKVAAYANDRVDRAILYGSDVVESICKRVFYPEDDTRSWDWPNWQYAPPWKLWLDAWELAATPTLVTAKSKSTSPVTIPSANYILHPVNSGPPFTSLELRRDLSSVFGGGPTPQLDIAITGTFGYWMVTRPAGTLTHDVAVPDTTLQVSGGSGGVGDVLICGTERMIVTDASFTDTSIVYAGLSSASASDKIVAVPDGTKFVTGEVLRADSEWVLIEDILGNQLIVRRAWEGSVLASHAGGTLWARRLLTVLRGALGTVAATHTTATALTVSEVPGLVRQVALGNAIVSLTNEPGAYAGGSQNESSPGAGLRDLETKLGSSSYSRSARSRAV